MAAGLPRLATLPVDSIRLVTDVDQNAVDLPSQNDACQCNELRQTLWLAALSLPHEEVLCPWRLVHVHWAWPQIGCMMFAHTIAMCLLS